MIKLFLFGIILTLLAVSACEKAPAPNTYANAKEDSFSADIDGKHWESGKDSLGNPLLVANFLSHSPIDTPPPGFYIISNQSIIYGTPRISLRIITSTDSLEKKTYVADFEANYISDDNADGYFSGAQLHNSGLLTITLIDIKRSIIAGDFSFNGSGYGNLTGKMLNVTNGHFNVHYTRFNWIK